jgi:hypothetical protein
VPGRAQLLARNADIAEEVTAVFADHDKLRQLAKQPGESEAPTRLPGTAPTAPPLGADRYVGDYELLEEIARADQPFREYRHGRHQLPPRP